MEMLGNSFGAQEDSPDSDGRRFEVLQLTPGTLAPEIESREADGSTLRFMRFGQGVQLRSTVTRGRVVVALLLATAPAASVVRNGTPWHENEAILFLSGAIDICATGPCRLAWLEMSRGELQSELDARGLADHIALSLPAPDGLVRDGLHSYEPVGRTVRGVARALRWARPAPQPGSARYAFARMAEDLMWQHVDALLSLRTISKLTSRSPRSVHYAFAASFGFGPLSYFKIRRLNAVRSALRDPGKKAPIIDIAAEFGFWHLGHFGTSYKHFFGERPSDTRARALRARAGSGARATRSALGTGGFASVT